MPERKVALICTVLNEARSIGELLGSISAQTRQPDEVVIVDGGSTDGTLSIVDRFRFSGPPLRLIAVPGCNISRGRNAAIASTDAEIIASTDAGVKLDPRWVEEIVAPFLADRCVEMVAGFFVSDPRSLFEIVLGATTLPDPDEIDPVRFLPSSRSVAFTRALWERVGRYPEWLDYCEDIVFDLAIRDSAAKHAFVPAALVYFRPRSSLPAYWRQYYLYGRGDGKAGLWPRRHLIRYISYLLGVLALLLGFWYKEAWLALVPAGVAYLSQPYRRLLPRLGPLGWRARAAAIVLVPVIRLIGDFAKMVGYPAGILWRWKRGDISGAGP